MSLIEGQPLVLFFYICLVLFTLTGLITLLAMIGWIKMPEEYTKKLFYVLILELVMAFVAVIPQFFQPPMDIVLSATEVLDDENSPNRPGLERQLHARYFYNVREWSLVQQALGQLHYMKYNELAELSRTLRDTHADISVHVVVTFSRENMGNVVRFHQLEDSDEPLPLSALRFRESRPCKLYWNNTPLPMVVGRGIDLSRSGATDDDVKRSVQIGASEFVKLHCLANDISPVPEEGSRAWLSILRRGVLRPALLQIDRPDTGTATAAQVP